MSLALGQPDPSTLKTTDFHNFTFQTIGKQPDLLRRISESHHEESARYYSTSPEPDSEYPPLPPANESRGLTRPTLLQALQTQMLPAPSGSSVRSGQPPPARKMTVKLEDESLQPLQLQYPETPVTPDIVPPSQTLSPTLFVPDYSGLKDVHNRLDAWHKVLALPPPPKKLRTPSPEFPRPSVIAANSAVHHLEQIRLSAKEALQASQARISDSEQSVAAAQAIVDNLTQALSAARTALEVAQKSLTAARQAAEDAQIASTTALAATDAAEETKRLLEAPPPPRVPTPEPVDRNAGIIAEMKHALDSLKIWAEESETEHLAAATAYRASVQRLAEQQSEASAAILTPEHHDHEPDVHNNMVAVQIHAKGVKMEEDEGRYSEEDAARALVTLAEQTLTAPVRDRQQQSMPQSQAYAVQRSPDVDPLQFTDVTVENAENDDNALAREAALRKLQDAKREQVRIQKEKAQADAAKSILKERQDAAAAAAAAAAANKTSPAPATEPQSHSSVVITRNVVAPPSAASEATVKLKKFGGVKPGPAVVANSEPTLPTPEVERAAALGLRVRPTPAPTKMKESRSAPSSKATPPKKTRNFSFSPSSRSSRELSPSHEISAYRVGSDGGNIEIDLSVMPDISADVSVDAQWMNAQFALRDQGVPFGTVPNNNQYVESQLQQQQPLALPIRTTVPSLPYQAHASVLDPLPSEHPQTKSIIGLPAKPLPKRKQPSKMPPKLADTHAKAPSLPSKPSNAPVAKQLPVTDPNKLEKKQGNVTAFTPGHTGDQSLAKSQPPFRPVSSKSNPMPSDNISRPANFNGRELDSWRGRSPPRMRSPPRARSPQPRSRTPDRYEDRSYYGGRDSDWEGMGPSDPYRPSIPDRRPLTPPSPRYVEPHAKRGYNGDHYSLHAPQRPFGSYTTGDSPPPPPRGPHSGVARVWSGSQKRLREDPIPQAHPQKRFKNDDRAPSPHRSKPTREPEHDRPALELRLGAAPDANVHSIGRGESYQPRYSAPGPDYEQSWAGTAKPEGLLSRLSDPSLATTAATPRGRGGGRGRATPRGRGRGRGAERSLVDRMD